MQQVESHPNTRAKTWSWEHELKEKIRDITGSLSRLSHLEIKGTENIPLAVPVIYAIGPHNGHMDGPIFRNALPHTLRRTLDVVAAQDTFSDPKMAFLASLFVNTLLLKRSDGNSTAGIRAIRKSLHSGRSVGIFPEGTRHKEPDTPMKERHLLPGLAYLITLTQDNFPVIPVYLDGLQEAMPRTSKFPKLIGNDITVTFGEPLEINPELMQRNADRDENRDQITLLIHNALIHLETKQAGVLQSDS